MVLMNFFGATLPEGHFKARQFSDTLSARVAFRSAKAAFLRGEKGDTGIASFNRLKTHEATQHADDKN